MSDSIHHCAAIHLLCLSADGERLSKPFGPTWSEHALFEFMALARMVGATPRLLSSLEVAMRNSPNAAQATIPLTSVSAQTLRGGPLPVVGISEQQGSIIGSRLIGLDLHLLLAAADTLSTLLSSEINKCNTFGDSPYHLLFYSWGRQLSRKTKKKWLQAIAASDLPRKCGCGTQIAAQPRVMLYAHKVAEKKSHACPSASPVLLSLLAAFHTKDGPRDADGMPALRCCILTVEAGGGAGLCGPQGLFATLSRFRIPAQVKNPGLTPVKPELAFVMTNLAQIHGGDGFVKHDTLAEHQIGPSWVLDPYAGSGSLLVPSAHFGAMTWASDINANCHDNFCGLSPPEVVAADIFTNVWSTGHHYVGRTVDKVLGTFDAIIADPPYGTREDRCVPVSVMGATPCKRSSRLCYIEDATGEEMLENINTMVRPLLELASNLLRPGGRLVYLFPTFCTQEAIGYWNSAATRGALVLREEQLPAHPQLLFESVSHQPCVSRIMARNIVVMKKKHSS